MSDNLHCVRTHTAISHAVSNRMYRWKSSVLMGWNKVRWDDSPISNEVRWGPLRWLVWPGWKYDFKLWGYVWPITTLENRCAPPHKLADRSLLLLFFGVRSNFKLKTPDHERGLAYQVTYQVRLHLFQRILRNMWGRRAKRTKSVHKEAHRISWDHWDHWDHS